MFAWHEKGPAVEWAVTDRHRGVSRAPYRSLNLARHVGDEPAAVAANRAVVSAALGLEADRVLFPSQCHGSAVAIVDGPWPGAPEVADALVTARDDVALGVLVADCVPVLIADVEHGVVAAVHAGRSGLLAGVVEAALAAMAGLGGVAPVAVVGPSVCSRCYEVPAEMRDAAAARVPASAAVSWTGTPAVDVASGVVSVLAGRGVPVRRLPGCTRERADLYSHRREQRTGRFAGLVRRIPGRPGPAGAATRSGGP